MDVMTPEEKVTLLHAELIEEESKRRRAEQQLLNYRSLAFQTARAEAAEAEVAQWHAGEGQKLIDQLQRQLEVCYEMRSRTEARADAAEAEVRRLRTIMADTREDYNDQDAQ